MNVVSLTGKSEGKLAGLADIEFSVPYDCYSYINYTYFNFFIEQKVIKNAFQNIWKCSVWN